MIEKGREKLRFLKGYSDWQSPLKILAGLGFTWYIVHFVFVLLLFLFCLFVFCFVFYLGRAEVWRERERDSCKLFS